MLTSFLKKKKKIFPISNTSTTENKAILPTNICREETKSQKTNDSFGNFYIDNNNINSIPKTILKQVSCI